MRVFFILNRWIFILNRWIFIFNRFNFINDKCDIGIFGIDTNYIIIYKFLINLFSVEFIYISVNFLDYDFLHFFFPIRSKFNFTSHSHFVNVFCNDYAVFFRNILLIYKKIGCPRYSFFLINP